MAMTIPWRNTMKLDKTLSIGTLALSLTFGGLALGANAHAADGERPVSTAKGLQAGCGANSCGAKDDDKKDGDKEDADKKAADKKDGDKKDGEDKGTDAKCGANSCG
jgi:hypothetical protein